MTSTLSRMGRPKKTEPYDPLRLPRSLLRRIRQVAAHLDKDAGDYVAERFAILLEKDEAKMLTDLERQIRGDK